MKAENIVDAIIEIPMGSKNKYEVDKKLDKIRLDRVIYSSMTYPAEYGYIEETLSLDGDPLDILVLVTDKTFPGCIIEARIVGYLDVLDNGHEDQKLIAVANVDPRFNHIDNIDDISEHTILEIKNFFETYKMLQGIDVIVRNIHNKAEALEELERSRNRYIETKKATQ
jgi:inorganic pyrophosphatase